MINRNVKESEESGIGNPFPIPLYLNQKYVFSLLAAMEGGYAQLENVKTTRSDEEGKSSKMSGDVGVTNAFAFLGIKFGAERGTESKIGDTQERTSERVHTPDSLFARLREELHYRGVVRTDDFADATPGEYVEFTATLYKNPLIEGLETVSALIEIAEKNELATVKTSSVQPINSGAKSGKTQGNSHVQPKVSMPEESKYATTLKQLNILLGSLRGTEGGTFYLVGNITRTPLHAVLVIDPSFANDPIAADLIDGQYTVLGKVVRAIPSGSEETIDLLRKGALGKVSLFLDLIRKAITGMGDAGINLPDVQNTTLSGPALQVVPIAIFM
jgi:hypothetical protein